MASTARQAARSVFLAAATPRNAHVGCRRAGCCTISSSSHTPLWMLDAQCAAMSATSCRRPIHHSAARRSAWPLGRDASPNDPASSNTAARAPKSDTLPPSERAITVGDIQQRKREGERIAMLTAYDYPSALGVRSAPVDICLVGDSLTNVALGHRTTHPLTLEAMTHHVQAVVRGLRHPMLNQTGMPAVPLLIADVPMGYAEISIDEGMRAAVQLVKHGGADGVKMEGGAELLPLVQRLASFGIPVMAHIGLQPQRSSSGSALNLAGRTAEQATELLGTALAMQAAGAFSCLLECIPARVGDEITKRLDIPTIGIGAGAGTDGQVLVTDDVLGECNSPLYVLAGLAGEKAAVTTGEEAPSVSADTATAVPRPAANTPGLPRFVRNFVAPLTNGSSIGAMRMAAVQAYVRAVKDRSFPAEQETYKMRREEWAAFKAALEVFDGERAAAVAAALKENERLDEM